ncbi:dUTP diphosphatase [Holdemania sp. Marseille-P2844]|uniref:dUTP diphosphatase n=1 Tax=Holdemania sp. Marseille-P2844 TaxID=1852366 RepID=UPI00093315C7|nr:dUTP diphosphatase [Holdemania sp. Marseille-P2844]
MEENKNTLRNQIRTMLHMQRELDKEILNKQGIKKYPYENIKIALIVEIGEMMNELPTKFKHWKSTAVDDREKALKEYVDVYHFLLSLCNEYKMNVPRYLECLNDAQEYQTRAEKEDKTVLLSKVLASLIWNVSEGYIDKAVGSAKLLADALGFTQDEIYEQYLVKNGINHQRQDQGY